MNRFGIRFGGQEAAFSVCFSCVFRRVHAEIGLGPLPGAQLSTKYSKTDNKTFTIDFASILDLFFHDMGAVLGATWVDFCKHSCILTTLSSLTLIDHNEATDCNNKRLRKTNPRVEGVGGCSGSISIHIK